MDYEWIISDLTYFFNALQTGILLLLFVKGFLRCCKSAAVTGKVSASNEDLVNIAY